MNDLSVQTKTFDDAKAEFAQLSDAALIEAAGQIAMTVAVGFVKLAAVVAIAEPRGIDLSDGIPFVKPLFPHLRRIACGQLVADVLIYCSKKPGLVGPLAKLPVPDQQKLVAGQPVPVVTTQNGQRTVLMMEPVNMGPAHVKQVFGPDGLRDEAQQVAWMDEQTRRQVCQVFPDRVGDFVFDRERGIVKVGKKEITFDKLIEAADNAKKILRAG